MWQCIAGELTRTGTLLLARRFTGSALATIVADKALVTLLIDSCAICTHESCGASAHMSQVWSHDRWLQRLVVNKSISSSHTARMSIAAHQKHPAAYQHSPRH